MQDTEKLYRVAVGGEEIGSYSVEELRSYWQGGSLDKGAVYLHEGTRQWRPVSQMFGPVRQVPSATSGGAAPAPRYARDGSLLVKAQKSRGIYIILAIFLGGFGTHNFYAGRFGAGAMQFLLTVVSLAVLPPLVVVVGFWILGELFAVKKDGAGDLMA